MNVDIVQYVKNAISKIQKIERDALSVSILIKK